MFKNLYYTSKLPNCTSGGVPPNTALRKAWVQLHVYLASERGRQLSTCNVFTGSRNTLYHACMESHVPVLSRPSTLTDREALNMDLNNLGIDVVIISSPKNK